MIFTTRTFHGNSAESPSPTKERPSEATPTAASSFPSHETSENGIPSFCDPFVDRNITISIKTGATESMDKLPTQLLTSLRCVSEPLIFSDLDQTLGAHHIYDVLSRFSPEAMKQNPDFDLYREQQDLVSQGRETELRSLANLPVKVDDWRYSGKSAAWGLDKYKFLHMIERAWELQPDQDWYIFIEADTYLSVPNLVRWLATQEPKQQLYLGSPIRMWEHPTILHFAYGGAGFVLSGAAMREFAVTHPGIANRFDHRVSKLWFGDFLVADALDEELHLQVTDAIPMLNPDAPPMIPFGEWTWCRPAITLHHMDSKQFDDIYKFEKSRDFSELLYRDVYAAAYTTGLPFKTENWDNLADDPRFALEVTPNDQDQIDGNFEPTNLLDPNNNYLACEIACIQNEKCFQFSFIKQMTKKEHGGEEPKTECHLSSIFRLGSEFRRDQLGPGTSRISGWRSDRIEKWIAEHQDCSG